MSDARFTAAIRLDPRGPDTPAVRVTIDGRSQWFPAEWSAEVDIPPYVRTVLTMVTDDDGPHCVGVTYATDGLDGDLLDQKMPTKTQLANLVRGVIARAASPVPLRPGSMMSMAPWPMTAPDSIRGTQAALGWRRARIDDRLLREVASMYREAVEAGVNPRAAIADRKHVSRSTVATWTEFARERIDPDTGETFLGPADGPRAGEAPRPPTKKGRGKP